MTESSRTSGEHQDQAGTDPGTAPELSSVLVVIMDKLGHIWASAHDCKSSPQHQEHRAKIEAIKHLFFKACHPDIADTIDDWQKETTLRILEKDKGWHVIVHKIGHKGPAP